MAYLREKFMSIKRKRRATRNSGEINLLSSSRRSWSTVCCMSSPAGIELNVMHKYSDTGRGGFALELFFPGPQLREELCGPAHCFSKPLIADETRSFRTIFKHELARVKCFELGAVPDADDGGFREPFEDQLHQLRLA